MQHPQPDVPGALGDLDQHRADQPGQRGQPGQHRAAGAGGGAQPAPERDVRTTASSSPAATSHGSTLPSTSRYVAVSRITRPPGSSRHPRSHRQGRRGEQDHATSRLNASRHPAHRATPASTSPAWSLSASSGSGHSPSTTARRPRARRPPRGPRPAAAAAPAAAARDVLVDLEQVDEGQRAADEQQDHGGRAAGLDPGLEAAPPCRRSRPPAAPRPR